MTAGGEGIAQHYRSFALAAEYRSPIYVRLANAIANDVDMLARLATLPPDKQQPNLLFGAVKYLFGVIEGAVPFRDFIVAHWEEVQDLILLRTTQTNEPSRCATLLPVLAQLRRPLALIEVGASAGLCLYPDRYGYDYGRVQLAPSNAEWPVLTCSASANTPILLEPLNVVWRMGLDLNPLDPCSADDARWLRALVWPEEGSREDRLGQALAAACNNPAMVVGGDLRRDLPSIVAQAPRDATLVIFHSAVLNYVRDPAERDAFVQTVRASGAEWIAQENPDLFSHENTRGWPAGSTFALTRNGETLARADSHGKWIEWLA